MDEGINLDKQDVTESPEVNLQDWSKKLKASEKLMKDEFLPPYAMAKRRLRSEYNVRRRLSANITHEQVNMVYSIGNNYVNSVYFKSPNCNLKAREEVDHENVENTEIKINDWLQDQKVKRVVKRCIWDAYMSGMAWRFVDYEYEDAESDQPIMQPDQLGNMAPVLGQDGQPQMQRIVLKNEIVIKRIRPDLMRFPRGFDLDNYQDSPWMAFDILDHKDSVLADESFDKEQVEQIKFDKYQNLSNPNQDNKKSHATYDSSEEMYAKLHYIFIRPETKMDSFKLLVFSKGCDKPLKFIEYDKGTVGYPVKPLYHNHLDDDSSYPKGDPWLWEAQLNAMDKWWKTYARHVERSNPHTIYDKTRVSSKEIEALKASDDLLYAGISNKDGVPLTNLFYDRQKPPVHPDVSAFFQVARGLLSELSPKSGTSRGSEDSNEKKTATQAKIETMGESVDLEARIDDIAEFVKDIVLDVAGILSKSLQGETVINKPMQDPVTGSQVEKPVGLTRDHFTDKINVDVEVETMQAQNKDVIRRQLIDMLTMMSTPQFQMLLQQSGVTLKAPFWLQKLGDVSNIRNIEEGFMPLPPTPAAPQQLPPPSGEIPQGQATEGGGVPMPPEAVEASLSQRT